MDEQAAGVVARTVPTISITLGSCFAFQSLYFLQLFRVPLVKLFVQFLFMNKLLQLRADSLLTV